MTTTLSWTRKNAISVLKAQKKLQKNLAKVAQDELAIANTDENVESAEGTAGPQEVIEAIDVIVDQLEEVQEAIPGDVPEEVEDDVIPEPEPQPEEVPGETQAVIEPDEDEKEIVAKQNSRIAELEKHIESQNKERVAEQYAELFDSPTVQQSKYNEVVKSTKTSQTWATQIAAIESYKKAASIKGTYKPAQNVTSWLPSRTKTAKLQASTLTHL